jgi:hypothetical protein
MFSSRDSGKDIVLAIYKEDRTVFRLNDIALLINESDFQSLNKKLNYYVRTGKLQNPRKGIYAKPGYDPEEMACSVFTPSYISLQYVLQKAGIVFQYDSRITSVSYLSRIIEIENREFIYRKIKGSSLVNTAGIIRQNNHINIASPERAFLDFIYLEKEFHFDNLNPLNKDIIYELLTLYQSNALIKAVKRIVKNG